MVVRLLETHQTSVAILWQYAARLAIALTAVLREKYWGYITRYYACTDLNSPPLTASISPPLRYAKDLI
jgi:hypothetical protein